MRRKLKGTIIVKIAYLCAGAIGYSTSLLFPELDLLWRTAIADVAATVVVFLFSHFFKNASIYDPYWSVIPMWLIVWWLIEMGASNLQYQDWIILSLVFAWGTRLTWNWWSGWNGMDHQDWRYTDLQKKHGNLYPLICFSGIHLFPTVLVFMGCLPIFFVIQNAGTYSMSPVLSTLGIVLTFGAIILESVADMQRRNKMFQSSGTVYRSGVWAWSRHPNYLGEIMFWAGLFVYILQQQEYYWTGIGALSMTLLFVFISIPLMEKRQVSNKPEYVQYQNDVPMLIPRRPKKT